MFYIKTYSLSESYLAMLSVLFVNRWTGGVPSFSPEALARESVS